MPPDVVHVLAEVKLLATADDRAVPICGSYRPNLAAYCAVLYVDERTAEDFARAQRKEPRLKGLIGDVAKAADFEARLGPSTC